MNEAAKLQKIHLPRKFYVSTAGIPLILYCFIFDMPDEGVEALLFGLLVYLAEEF